MILQNGARVRDRYLIDSLVGQGGMGAVYRATDLHLGHSVAIKENLLQVAGGTDSASDSGGPTDSRRSQFEREAQLLARLKHPGLPKVTDHFVIPEQGQYLVMEFVEGEDLSTRLKRVGPMTELEAVALIRRVSGILAYLHSQKPPIIHRDIKPANIRQTPEGEIVVVDFGVAKVFSSEATVTAARAVTPGFSPLEQYGGSQSTDERSDIYALGATLHQLVTGKRPPEATSRITQTATGKGLGWLELTGVSQMLGTVIRKAMELRPEDRYQKIADFAGALEGVEAASSLTQTRPAVGYGAGADVAPTAPAPPQPPPAPPAPAHPATSLPSAMRRQPSPPPAQAPPTQPATFAVPATPPAPPAPPPVQAAPAPPPVAATPPAPAPTPSIVGTPAYGPPPSEKRPNRMPLFIGVGALVLLLAGGGYMLFGRGSGPQPSSRPTGDLLAGSGTAQTPAGTTPVDDRANTTALPPAPVTQTEPGPPAAPPGGSGAATSNVREPARPAATPTTGNAATTSGAAATGKPASSPPAPVTSPPGGETTTPTRTNPPAETRNPPPNRPPSNDSGSDLVPLTDNPSRPPAGSTSGQPAGAGSATPPSQGTVTPPPVTPPPTSGGVSPGTSTPPVPVVEAPAVVGDTLVVEQTGASGKGSLTDAIQLFQEAYRKDGRVRTLLLKPGVYQRITTVFVGNAGRLIGSGPPGSVVIAYSGGNPGLSLEGVDIVVKNITVRANGKSALSASKGRATVENCEFSSTGSHGVQLIGSASVAFSRCRMSSSTTGRGLFLSNGTARLDNCDVTGNELGVEVAGGTLTMTGGSIKDNLRSGLRTRGSGRADLSNVSITGNGRHGVSIEGGSVALNSCTVTGNAQSGAFCAGQGGQLTVNGGNFTRNTSGAIVDSCGAVTKTGSIQEK